VAGVRLSGTSPSQVGGVAFESVGVTGGVVVGAKVFTYGDFHGCESWPVRFFLLWQMGSGVTLLRQLPGISRSADQKTATDFDFPPEMTTLTDTQTVLC